MAAPWTMHEADLISTENSNRFRSRSERGECWCGERVRVTCGIEVKVETESAV